MKTRVKRRRQGFLEPYRLEDAYLLKPDRKMGRPGMYAGTNPDGDAVLVKVWPRAGKGDESDLEEIWRHELRQLHRLAGYPGALDYIAQLGQAGFDRDGFYLVLDPGQRRPLQTVLDGAPTGHWLRHTRQASGRARMWRNLRRAAMGLETLHAQGLLHRNLDAWAILTSGSDEPDFQLTGFEWSMRVIGAGASNSGTPRARPTGATADSFLQDWLLFGLLAADLLKIDRARLLASRLTYSEVSEHAGVEEVRLLRNIVQIEPLQRLDGHIVAQRIDEVLGLLAAEIAGQEPRLHLVFRVGTGALAEKIRAKSNNEIETTDVEAQLDFVRADLSGTPMLLALKPRDQSDGFRLVLRGHNLHYALREYVYPRSPTPTWDFAYCDDAERNAPAPVNVIGGFTITAGSLEIMGSREAPERFARLRGKLRSWEHWRRKFSAETAPLSAEDRIHRALTLTQFLEALFAAADVFPVEVLPASRASPENGATLRLRSRRDPERDSLSKALNLRPPAIRLEYALSGDRVRDEGWILTDSNTLGERNPNDTEWRFQQIERGSAEQPAYLFSGTAPAPALSEAFLVPEGSVGRDVQFRRRLKALRALKDHGELTRMLADPRRRILESHESLREDDAFRKLDEPKQEALRELIATIPLYLVQGPPGVGKTRLVRDMTRRRFAEEPTTRLLLTAQSNSAINHLMDELGAVLEGDPREGPLVVRCRARDSSDEPGRFEIGVQAQRILEQLTRSPLGDRAPSGMKRMLAQLAASQGESSRRPAATAEASRSSQQWPSQAARAFEGVVMRAANVVFATTNSADLERLIEERAQFDWAIVEEAGKATGSELISPLLLSHRRLMIGDHKQLPPFGADQIVELLKDHQAVRNALLVGEDFIGRSLRDETTEEILDEIEDEVNDLPALCTDAMRVLTIFEAMIEAEFKRQQTSTRGKSVAKPIAKKLTKQHRMAPAIAKVVSRSFYGGELDSHPDCIARFLTESRPFVTVDEKRLPPAPIALVDMLYVQDTIGRKRGDSLPRWHNPDEVAAVLEALELVRAAADARAPPSLAVLSPYSQQVRRLAQAISDARADRLSHLSDFDSPLKASAFCGTVDSFQGSEADLVIVSLVRNNHHGNVRGALGFLSDFRRMNVLLSRARWQLVLIGSMNFLAAVMEAAKGTEDEKDVEFLRLMLEALREGKADGGVAEAKLNAIKT